MGNWEELKGKLQQRFTKLTNEDLFFEYGKEDDLLTRLEKKLGKEKREITAIIENLQSENIELDMDETTSLITE